MYIMLSRITYLQGSLSSPNTSSSRRASRIRSPIAEPVDQRRQGLSQRLRSLALYPTERALPPGFSRPKTCPRRWPPRPRGDTSAAGHSPATAPAPVRSGLGPRSPPSSAACHCRARSTTLPLTCSSHAGWGEERTPTIGGRDVGVRSSRQPTGLHPAISQPPLRLPDFHRTPYRGCANGATDTPLFGRSPSTRPRHHPDEPGLRLMRFVPHRILQATLSARSQHHEPLVAYRSRRSLSGE